MDMGKRCIFTLDGTGLAGAHGFLFLMLPPNYDRRGAHNGGCNSAHAGTLCGQLGHV